MNILRTILFCVLFFLVGFFLGIQVASIVDAGKGQMLAGGAIVLGYGVVGAFLGLVASIFLSTIYKTKPSVIILLNKILAVLLFCLWLFFYLKYQNREEKKKDQIGYQIDIMSKSKYKNTGIYYTLA